MRFLLCTLVASFALTGSLAFAKTSRKPNDVAYNATALVICKEGKSLLEVQGHLNHALTEGSVVSNRISVIGNMEPTSLRVGSVSAPTIVIDDGNYTLCVTVTKR